jgi:hypothetical protein
MMIFDEMSVAAMSGSVSKATTIHAARSVGLFATNRMGPNRACIIPFSSARSASVSSGMCAPGGVTATIPKHTMRHPIVIHRKGAGSPGKRFDTAFAARSTTKEPAEQAALMIAKPTSLCSGPR